MPEASPARRRRPALVRIAALSSLLLLFALPVGDVACGGQSPEPATARAEIPSAERATAEDLSLAEDGGIDHLAAYNAEFGKGVTPENNAAVLVLKAFGSELWSDEPEQEAEELMAQMRAALGLRAGTPLPDRWVSLEELIEARRAAQPADGPAMDVDALEALLVDCGTHPWRTEDCPVVAAWLAANAESLDLLAEASARERWFLPIVGERGPMGLIAAYLPAYSPLRQAARAFAARATLSVAEERLAAARDDALAMRRLGRLLASQEGDVIGRLVGTAIETLAGQVDMVVASDPRVPSRMKQDLAMAILALPEKTEDPRVWDKAERWMLHEALIGHLHEMRMTLDPQGQAWAREVMDGWVDRVVAASKLSGWAERSAALRAIEEETDAITEELALASALPKLLASGGDPREKVARLAGLTCWLQFCTALHRYHAEQIGGVQRAEVHALALLLAVYKAENGDYPDALSDLVPGLLDEVPLDRFTEANLIYRRMADGYLLYSLGPNMTDDGGPYEDRDISDDVGVIVPP
jgi:hypothetical protein